jgi:aspartyl-tRNA(Asn)/glutamyl-tRNA(Gln) amidotransferase subunit A
MGSDTGGSIRLPAAYCGLVGLKVTAGRLPLHGIMPLSQSLDTPGPIAQTVLDCLIMFDVLDGREGWKIAQDMENGDGLYAVLNKGVSGLRLGSLADSERQQCSEDMLASYDVALDRLRAMGAKITPFENPVSYGDMADDNGMITAVEAFHNHGRFYKDPDLPMDEDVRTRMLLGEHYHAHDYFRVLQQRKEIMADFGDAMRGFDALVMQVAQALPQRWPMSIRRYHRAISPGHLIFWKCAAYRCQLTLQMTACQPAYRSLVKRMMKRCAFVSALRLNRIYRQSAGRIYPKIQQIYAQHFQATLKYYYHNCSKAMTRKR